MAKKSTTFNAQVRVCVDVDMIVRANSLEEAVTKAKELRVTEVVDIQGDYLDGNIRVISVGDYSPLPE